MDMRVTFPGGKRVDAEYKGFTIHTDQSAKNGGEASAPSPFDLFLVSIGTCAGIFVLSFLQERNLPFDGANLGLHFERDQNTHMVQNITIDINLPANFPQKYKKAVKSAAELCSVKKHLSQAPSFDLNVNIG